MERQYEDQEKQFKIYISDKRLVSKIYQEFWKCKKQKEKKNMKIFNKKMNKRHEKTCHRRECTDGK